MRTCIAVAASLAAAAWVGAGLASPATPTATSSPPSFAICAVCHRAAAGAAPALGPNLWRIGTRTSGTLPGFVYSPAMKAARIPWRRDRLIAFIMDPRTQVPGTRMAYAGQKDAKQAAAIADYLLSLK